MDSIGGSYNTKRQLRLANRFGLLVVLFMLFSAVFATVGNISPAIAAQPDCPEGQVLNSDTGECEPAVEAAAAQPDCAEDEVMNPLTGLCEPPFCDEGETLNPDTGACEPIVEPPLPECAEDEVLNEDTGECDPAVDPTEVTDDGTDDTTDGGMNDTTDGGMDDAMDGDVIPSDEPLGMVDIYKYECSFTDEYPDLNQYSDCTQAVSDVVFEAYDSVGVVGGGATNSDGYLSIGDLPLGQVSIVEVIPDGYGQPAVFCAGGDDPNSLDGFEGYEVIDGNSVTIGFADIAYYSCSWFNIPEDDGGITITKYDCPEGYVSTDGQVSGLRTNCVDSHDGVVFDLSNEAGYAESGETGDDSPGTLVFNDLALGSYTLTEQVPAGYGTPYVLCGYAASPNDDGPLNTTAAAAAGGVWDLEYTRPDRLDCEWFNIPSDSGIDIYKWLCPVDEYGTDTTYDTLLQDCTQEQDGVEFSLGNGTASYDSGLTGDDGPGRLTFEDYQPGAVVITETIPDGYGTPAVICSSQIYIEEPDGSVQYTSLPTDIMDVAADGSIVTEVAADRHYICNWFNFPSSDDYDIIIQKWLCPAGYYAEGFGYGELLTDCTADTLDGVVFYVGDRTQATGEVIPGGVAFAGYEPGELVIREEVPAGYGTPIVYCGQSSGGVAWNQMTPEPMPLSLAEDGRITVNLPENSRLICYWYNFQPDDATDTTDGDVAPPDEPTGSIDIFKMECPPEFSAESSNRRYFQQETPDSDIFIASCTEPMGGVTFGATADQGTIVGGGATEPGGYLSLRQLPLQQVAIVESIPDGYGAPRVFCFDDSTGEYVEYAVTAFSITVEFTLSNYYSCYWFNIPTGDATTDGDVVPPDASTGIAPPPPPGTFDVASEYITDPEYDSLFGSVPTGDLVPTDGSPPGSIDIFARNCPSGFSGESNLDEFVSTCTVAVSGREFSAYKASSATTGRLVGRGSTNSNGNLELSGLGPWQLGPGPIWVRDTHRDGYVPRVFCGYADNAATAAALFYLVSFPWRSGASITSISIEFDTVDYYSCYWFYVPGDYGSGTPTPGFNVPVDEYYNPVIYGIAPPEDVVSEDGTIPEYDTLVGTMDIFKFECPSGFAGGSSTLEEYRSMCTAPMAGVDFEAYDYYVDLGGSFVVGGATDSGGYLQLNGLGSGQVLVGDPFQDLESSQLRVFCGYGDDANSTGGYYYDWSVTQNYIVIDFTSINYYSCYWFNIPDG